MDNIRMFDVRTRESWIVVPGEAEAVSWSPKSDMIAFMRDDNNNTVVWSVSIDATTGKAIGPAQRVSVGYGENPTISPDSKWIAYQAVDSASVDLVIVPATGGPSRTLMAGALLASEIFWSADGKSIYTSQYLKRQAPGVNVASSYGNIVKFRVEGGAPQVIYKAGEMIAGMTADRRHLVLVAGAGSLSLTAPGEQGTVIDTTGRVVGHFPLPTGEKQFDRVLGDSALVWITTTDERVLEVRPTAGGPAKRLPLIGESNDAPSWSPDGKRIAFTVRDSSRRTLLAISNADGSNPRVFRDNPTPFGFWSPDSRFLAQLHRDRPGTVPTPGEPVTLSVLDVTTGTQRAVVKDSMFNYRWRDDGKSFVLIRFSPDVISFYELSLNGKQTKLSDAPRRSRGMNFIGNSAVFMRSDSGAFIQPVVGGPARRIADIPAGTRPSTSVYSDDGRWVAGQLLGNGASGRSWTSRIELFSVETRARTVLELPFAMSGLPDFVPGDNSLFVIGRSASNAPVTIYRVPLNGDTPRAFAEIGKVERWRGTHHYLSVSPDGKFVAYGAQPEASTISLGVISLRGAIPGSRSRAP
jgi:dipeptidyl aminopeptidase/acylaminoacyl peptidase